MQWGCWRGDQGRAGWSVPAAAQPPALRTCLLLLLSESLQLLLKDDLLGPSGLPGAPSKDTEPPRNFGEEGIVRHEPLRGGEEPGGLGSYNSDGGMGGGRPGL